MIIHDHTWGNRSCQACIIWASESWKSHLIPIVVMHFPAKKCSQCSCPNVNHNFGDIPWYTPFADMPLWTCVCKVSPELYRTYMYICHVDAELDQHPLPSGQDLITCLNETQQGSQHEVLWRKQDPVLCSFHWIPRITHLFRQRFFPVDPWNPLFVSS